MKHIEIPYGDHYMGDLYLPEGDEPHPCLILFHAWMGKDGFILQKAEELVETLGIATFCVDLYGVGKSVKSKEEATDLMEPLAKNPQELLSRSTLAYETVKKQNLVKKESMGALGFCFGGHAAIELFRSGVPLKGVCAFHPVISKGRVKSLPLAKQIQGKLLLLLGYQDPLINKEDLYALQKDLTEANIDWQINTYGLAFHAFTNPDAHDPEIGLVHNSSITSRSFAAMGHFFQSIL